MKAEFTLNFIMRDRWKMLVTGLENTLLMTAGALCIGILIGVIVAVIRSVWETNGKNMRGFPKFILRILNLLLQLCSLTCELLHVSSAHSGKSASGHC